MYTFDENIARLEEAKNNIKEAIEEKGVFVGNGLINTYANKIRMIKGGKLQPKTKTITKNNTTTTITPDEGFDGMEQVTIKTQIPIQNEKSESITENGNYTINVDEGYEGLKKVKVDVQVEGIPVQETKTETIVDNGSYTILPDEGFEAIGNVTVDVNIPIQDTKSLEITKNGSYTISADEEYEGMKQVDVVVSLPETGGKTKIYNGISFRTSTFETLEWDKYDWSDVYDGYLMFYNCPNFNDVKGALDNIPLLCTIKMFEGCNGIKEVKDIDLTPYLVTENMFSGCTNIEKVSNVVFNSQNINLGSSGKTFFDETCNWTNVVRDNNSNFVSGRFAYINGFNDSNKYLFGGITTQVLNCDKPTSMVGSGTTIGAISNTFYFYKENAGWEDALPTSRSCPIGLHCYVTDTENEHNVVFVDDDGKVEDKFEYLGNGQYYRPYTHSMIGTITVDGNTVMRGSWATSLKDIVCYYPIQPIENVTYEGEMLLKLVSFTLKNWEFDSEKKALKSNYHTAGNNTSTQAVKNTNCIYKITTKGFNRIDVVYGQSSEQRYDYMSVWGGDTLIFSAYNVNNDNIMQTFDVGDYDTIEFSYNKDSTGEKGEDAAWIKSIKYYNV